MREILFRAKHIHIFPENECLNGMWVYGFLEDNDYINSPELEGEFLIDPETVCQYTGLTDKNGRKIFEGDILAIPYSKKQGLPAEVRYNVLSGSYEIKRNGYKPISLMDADEWGEIVGNVFDNPEIVNKMKQELVEDGI